MGEFGFVPFLKKNSNRYGAFAAALIVFAVLVFASGKVYDVRIRGNENMSAEAVETELAKAGLYVGADFRSISLSKVKNTVLSDSDGIGWININRRGTVAYVELREKRSFSDEEDHGFSNVVALQDCVIEQITVKSGLAMVKVGDTVKAGDLLISGVLPEDMGGGFVNADGIVLGRIYDESTVSVPRCESIDTLKSSTESARGIKIFNFSINIFKKYSNYVPEYDIIKNNKQLYLFGKYRLPIAVTSEYAQKYVKENVTHTDKELIDIAQRALSESRASRFLGCEVVMLKTVGRFTENGYELTDKASLIRDVGEEKYFYN
jgi:similar to stage IV sporulation protein